MLIINKLKKNRMLINFLRFLLDNIGRYLVIEELVKRCSHLDEKTQEKLKEETKEKQSREKKTPEVAFLEVLHNNHLITYSELNDAKGRIA